LAFVTFLFLVPAEEVILEPLVALETQATPAMRVVMVLRALPVTAELLVTPVTQVLLVTQATTALAAQAVTLVLRAIPATQAP
jgi:hypothetical protein